MESEKDAEGDYENLSEQEKEQMFFKRFFKQNNKVGCIIFGSRNDLNNQELYDRHRFIVEIVNELQGHNEENKSGFFHGSN